MPSSTSSSNDRLPDGPSGRILITGLVLALLAFTVGEGVVRSLGYRPSVTDDAPLWSLQRSELRRWDRDEVVLIGASRTQADIDPVIFSEEFGGRTPKQLGIAGANPLPVLDDLSRDESFTGLIICDVMPIYFFTGLDFVHGQGYEFATYAHKDKPWDRAATRAHVFLESRAALLSPDAAPSAGLAAALVGLRPAPRQEVTTDAERFARFNRRAEDVSLEYVAEQAGNTLKTHPVSAEQLDRDIATLNRMVHRIQARGGRVVFDVLPVSGLRRQAEEQRFPRAQFWDRFAAGIDAPTIHFEDEPSLSEFTCHDGSHLAAAAATAFTRAFMPVLKSRLAHADTHVDLSSRL